MAFDSGEEGRKSFFGRKQDVIVSLEKAFPSYDTEELDCHPSVLESELVVRRAVGRWATSCGLGPEKVEARIIDKIDVLRLLAAAGREDLKNAA